MMPDLLYIGIGRLHLPKLRRTEREFGEYLTKIFLHHLSILKIMLFEYINTQNEKHRNFFYNKIQLYDE